MATLRSFMNGPKSRRGPFWPAPLAPEYSHEWSNGKLTRGDAKLGEIVLDAAKERPRPPCQRGIAPEGGHDRVTCNFREFEEA